MKILRRAGGAVEHIWASYPFIGIMVLFIAIGFGVYQGSKAKVYAKQSVGISKQNGVTIEQLRKTQQDALAEKDRRIAEKDSQIATSTVVIGQLYDDALALQQQVIMLHGIPKSIPIVLPSNSTPQNRTFVTPSVPPSSFPIPLPTSIAPTKECKLGIQAAPLNIVQLQVCIPPSKGP